MQRVLSFAETRSSCYC